MNRLQSPPEFPVQAHQRDDGSFAVTMRRQSPQEGVAITEISQAVIQDWRIRAAIEYALTMSEVEIQTATKILDDLNGAELDGMKPLELQYPATLPNVNLNEAGTANNELQKFVFDTYEVLAEHFNGSEWRDWYVAPYFLEGDDTRRVFRLGVFVVQSDQMVVE